MSTAVDPSNRFTAELPCPVCGGYASLGRGKGKRCDGYRTADGAAAFCARVDSDKSVGHLFHHYLFGRCGCRATHNPWENAPPEVRERRRDLQERRIVATYDYSDEAGKLLFQVVRFDPKDFRQRRPGGAGDWIWNVRDVRLVPYHLHEIVAAATADDPIYVCEGEKDADRVRALGLAASCNPMGAKKWRSEYADHFRGASDVRVVADRDRDGYQHATQVAASLRAVGARVVVLEAAVGKDLSEHLDAGHGLDELVVIDPAEKITMLESTSAKITTLRAIPGGGSPGRFFGEGGLVVPRLGDEIRALGPVVPGIDGRLYRYAEGVYRADGDCFARGIARQLLGDLFKRRHVDEALAYLRSFDTAVSDQQPEGLVNVRNGLLDWRAGPPILRPHDPAVVSTIQLPIAWNPEARCPRIGAFLAAVVPDAVSFVLEMIGYALLPANPLRVAVLLLGPGRNGKSVLLAVVKELLGAENVSVVPLQVMTENRFAAAELFGKLANICGDLDARAIKQTDSFKMLTGGDPMLAERKHRDHFTFQPFALPLFSANEPPLSSDQTEAWFDRWLVVPMERRIPEAELDPHLASKLTTREELEGLLVLAVEGLRRLMARGRFDLPASVQRARLAYRERLDTVTGFVGEECRLDPDAWTRRSALYGAYRKWASDGGRLPVSAATFNDRMRNGFADRASETKRTGIIGWAGIYHPGAQ